MAARRFEVTRVPEPTPSTWSVNAVEILPLVHTENEIPAPPPLPTSLSTTNRLPFRFFNAIARRKSFDTRRRATVAAAAAAAFSKQAKKSSSTHTIPEGETTFTASQLPENNQPDESDADGTHHSNNYDSNPLRLTNKFLQELRSKRSELRARAKNLSIDQRIAFNRRENARHILRAQDIFDVHFELDDEDNPAVPTTDLFTEESQEKIRNDIFKELNRQRKKQYHKHHRHLLLGRALLMLMTCLIAFMSLTLIYVVLDLYDRARSLDAKLPDSEFIPMIFDKSSSVY